MTGVLLLIVLGYATRGAVAGAGVPHRAEVFNVPSGTPAEMLLAGKKSVPMRWSSVRRLGISWVPQKTGFDFLSLLPLPGAGTSEFPPLHHGSPAAFDWLNGWQFFLRAAAQPRAPCLS